MKIQLFEKNYMHGAGLSHASKSGSPVLRDAPWWKDINGVWFTTRRTTAFITFRRATSRNNARFSDLRRRSR